MCLTLWTEVEAACRVQNTDPQLTTSFTDLKKQTEGEANKTQDTFTNIRHCCVNMDRHTNKYTNVGKSAFSADL